MIDKPKARDYGYRSWLVVYKLAAKTGNSIFTLTKQKEIVFVKGFHGSRVPESNTQIETIELTLNELKVLAFDELLPLIPNADQCKEYKKTLYRAFPTHEISELRDLMNRLIDIQEKD